MLLFEKNRGVDRISYLLLKHRVMRSIQFILSIALVVFLATSCSKKDDKTVTNSNSRTFGSFSVLTDNTTIQLNGEISSSSLNDFNRLVLAYPNVKIIHIKQCDGSSDDQTNLQLSKVVHQRKMSIHLMDNGLIASGGVDFFFTGTTRTKGSNTKIGVHSWAAGNGVTATNFPKGHANHLPYINYYVSVGFTQKQAEDFYYFTIHAASANSMHWMTDEEIKKYHLLKP